MQKMNALEGKKQKEGKKHVRYLVWLRRDLCTYRLSNPAEVHLLKVQVVSMIVDDISDLRCIPEGNWAPPTGAVYFKPADGWSALVIKGQPVLIRSMEIPREGTDEWLMREQRELWEEPAESKEEPAHTGEGDNTEVLSQSELGLIRRASMATVRWIGGILGFKAQKGDQ